jgi:argininosuccinate synthase
MKKLLGIVVLGLLLSGNAYAECIKQTTYPRETICAPPGGTVLTFAHRAIESITLDKETMHKKDELMPRYAELIYNGYWFSKEREKLQKIIDRKRNKVNGTIKIALYKGNLTLVSRVTRSKAYSMKKVSFEENKTFNKKNVENFIKKHSRMLRK